MHPAMIVEAQPVHVLILSAAADLKMYAVEKLYFQRSEQRLGNGIVPAVTLFAHGAFHPESLQLHLEVATGYCKEQESGVTRQAPCAPTIRGTRSKISNDKCCISVHSIASQPAF